MPWYLHLPCNYALALTRRHAQISKERKFVGGNSWFLSGSRREGGIQIDDDIRGAVCVTDSCIGTDGVPRWQKFHLNYAHGGGDSDDTAASINAIMQEASYRSQHSDKVCSSCGVVSFLRTHTYPGVD